MSFQTRKFSPKMELMPIRLSRVTWILILVLYLGCSSDNQKPPGSLHVAARSFLQCLANEQFDEAWQMVAESQKKDLTFSKFKNCCMTFLKKTHLEKPSIQIKACSEKNGKGIAHCALVQGSKRYKLDLEFRLDQEQWMVFLGRDFDSNAR